MVLRRAPVSAIDPDDLDADVAAMKVCSGGRSLLIVGHDHRVRTLHKAADGQYTEALKHNTDPSQKSVHALCLLRRKGVGSGGNGFTTFLAVHLHSEGRLYLDLSLLQWSKTQNQRNKQVRRFYKIYAK